MLNLINVTNIIKSHYSVDKSFETFRVCARVKYVRKEILFGHLTTNI